MSNRLTFNEFRKRFKVVNPLDLAAEERCKYYDPFVERDAPSAPLCTPSFPAARSLYPPILEDRAAATRDKRERSKEKSYAACI